MMLNKVCIIFRLGGLGPIFQAFTTCIIYSLFIIMSALFQRFGSSINMPFMAMTYVLVFTFIIGVIVTWFCFPLPEMIKKNSRNQSAVAPEGIKTEE